MANKNGSGKLPTPRKIEVLKAIQKLNPDGKGTGATNAAVAGVLGVTLGPVFNHLQDLKKAGLANHRTSHGKTIDGSWYVTERGVKALAKAGTPEKQAA